MLKFNKNLFTKFKKIKIAHLFYNNKFVILFSILTSFLIWLIIAGQDNESSPITIADIPVDIPLSESAKQDGLRVFNTQNLKAQVEITGNRIVVGQVTKDNIQVTATQSASTITAPGNYVLELSAKKVGVLQDYQIVSSVKPSVINVKVDRYRESEFVVEPSIDLKSKPDYYVGSPSLSPSKVTLSGPETEITRIKKVVVEDSITDEVDSSITKKLPIVLYDSYGKVISSELISCSSSEVEVTVPVLMKKELEIIPTMKNVPNGMDLNNNWKDIIKISPSKIVIAGPKDVISELKNIYADEIDFSQVNLSKNKFNIPINLPQGCKSLDNNYSAEVTVNTSGFKEKGLNITNFELKNVPTNKSVKIYNGNIDITVLAPTNKIGLIKSSNISAIVDCSNIKDNTANSTELPVSFSIIGHNDVWIYGSYYVNVGITNN